MIIFVIYNVITLPLMIGLEIEFREEFHVFEYIIDLCFGIDLVINFFTGYMDDNNRLILD